MYIHVSSPREACPHAARIIYLIYRTYHYEDFGGTAEAASPVRSVEIEMRIPVKEEPQRARSQDAGYQRGYSAGDVALETVRVLHVVYIYVYLCLFFFSFSRYWEIWVVIGARLLRSVQLLRIWELTRNVN